MESDERFERIERTMEFLAQSQVRFDANQARSDANQARHEESQARFDARMNKISVELETVVRMQRGQLEVLDTVLAAQRRTELKIQKLVEQTRRTDNNMNALIKVVDGIITNRPQ